MKANKLSGIIHNVFSGVIIKTVSENEKYDYVEFNLPDGGVVSVGIEPPTRQCKSSFLHFNIHGSPIRLKCSCPINGKHNYFGNNPELELMACLNELKSICYE